MPPGDVAWMPMIFEHDSTFKDLVLGYTAVCCHICATCFAMLLLCCLFHKTMCMLKPTWSQVGDMVVGRHAV